MYKTKAKMTHWYVHASLGLSYTECLACLLLLCKRS